MNRFTEYCLVCKTRITGSQILKKSQIPGNGSCSKYKPQVQPEPVRMETCVVYDPEGRSPVQAKGNRGRLETVFESPFSRNPESEWVSDPCIGTCTHIIIEVIIPQLSIQEIIQGFNTHPVTEGNIGMESASF